MDDAAWTRRLGNVVVGTDFTRHSHEAVARAMWLPISPGSSVTLLHAIPADMPADVQVRLRAAASAFMKGALDTASAEAARAGLRTVDVFDRIVVGSAVDWLCEQARDGRAEWVVVGRGERRGLGERLLGSTAERVVRAAPCSVLVVANGPQGPYRRALVAVDFSDASARALEMAVRIARVEGGTIDVVHAYRVLDANLFPDVVLTQKELERYAAESAAEARRKLEAWLPRPPGVDLNVQLVPGDPRRVIAERAMSGGAELIVVGHHDRSLLGRMVLGSVSSAVVRGTSVDVLVVR